MSKNNMLKGSVMITVFSLFLFNACRPLREFGKAPAYLGANSFPYERPAYDNARKTVVIIANNDGTELFDMMAPYYLFNATEKANVYIVAKNKFPIVVRKGFFLLPQLSFTEVDSLQIKPDVMVIPFLSAADSVHQDPVIINWIRKHYLPGVNILSVCDGAATAAATGIFDNKPLTAHASDYAGIKAQFSKPLWIQDTSVVHDGNLYSTAGVSNAAEGSLLLINQLFGGNIMSKVISKINYPGAFPKLEHKSNNFHLSDKLTVGKKIMLKGNRSIGVLLQEGINEFDLAAIMDTYNRSFPKSIESFSINDLPVRTKYGLTLLPTGKMNSTHLDELHVLSQRSFSTSSQELFNAAEIVKYDPLQQQYMIDHCLQRIRAEYGPRFEKVVRLMLDYN